MAILPIVTSRRDVDVRVVYGQTVFALYQQIQRLIGREAPELTHLFAEPVINAIRGEISWSTRATGSIARVSDLPTEDRPPLLQKLNGHHAKVRQLIERLERGGKANSSAAEALKNMLVVVDLNASLFRVGDQLVLAQWGCFPFGTDVRNADLYEQIDRHRPKSAPEPQAFAATPPTEEEPATPATAASANAQSDEPVVDHPLPPDVADPGPGRVDADEAPPEPPPVEAGVIDDGRPGFWERIRSWWLLLPLLLLLLIGILWKLSPSHRDPAVAALQSEISELSGRLEACIPGDSATPTDQPSISAAEVQRRQQAGGIDGAAARVNVSLAWGDTSDLDLAVIQPDGHVVSFKPCKAASCGTLDIDANRCLGPGDCGRLSTTPLENISWQGQMTPGTYIVMVSMYSSNRAPSDKRPVPFVVQVTRNGNSKSYQGQIQPEEHRCEAQRCLASHRKITHFTVD